MILVGGCAEGRRQATPSGYAFGDDDRTLVVFIDAYNADDNRAKVEESEEQVVIDITTDDAIGGDDCAHGVTLSLAEPLGGREVIDASADEPVSFTP